MPLSGRGQLLRLSDLECAVQRRQHVRPLYRGCRRAAVRADDKRRGRYARARGASRLQGEQMARRARHPRQRWPGRLRDRLVPEGWRQTHRCSVGADVCAGHRCQPYRLSPHARDRVRRAHALGVDGTCRVGRSGHYPQRDRQAAVVAPAHARDRGHAGAQFSAVVGDRQPRQVGLYCRRRDQGRL